MPRQLLSTTLVHSLVATILVASLAASLGAQASASPIRHSLYLALGGDPTSQDLYMNAARAVSAGVERSQAGSRWSMRLGVDYRRQTSNGSLGSSRLEEFGVNLSARYSGQGRRKIFELTSDFGFWSIASFRSRSLIPRPFF